MGKPVNKTLQIAAMSGGVELGHVSGPIVSFRSNGDPLRSLLVNIDPVQEGTGDPSPDNVRPISGWSAVNVWRTGKNRAVLTDGTVTTNNVTFTKSNNIVTCSGTSTGAALVTSEMFSVSEGEVLSIMGCPAGGSGSTYRIDLRDANGLISGAPYDIGSGAEYTIPSGVSSIRIGIRVNAGVVSDSLVFKPVVCLKNTKTVVPISWQTEAGTVYGGTLDVTTGVLTVDMQYDQMTYSYLSGLASGYIGFNSNLSLFGNNAVWVRNWHYADYPEIVVGGIKAMCNAFRISMHNKDINSTQYRTYFDVGSMTSVADFLLAVQTLETNGDGLWIAHQLATPIEYTLTPQQISSLVGENNVWADTGDVDVTYVAVGGEGGKLALLLRKRKELLIALRKGLTPADAGLLSSTLSTPPSLGNVLSPGAFKPGLTPDIDKEEDDLW